MPSGVSPSSRNCVRLKRTRKHTTTRANFEMSSHLAPGRNARLFESETLPRYILLIILQGFAEI